jgi:hypothetical protein
MDQSWAGLFRNGKAQESWQKKIVMCQQCEVFQNIFPPDLDNT